MTLAPTPARLGLFARTFAVLSCLALVAAAPFEGPAPQKRKGDPYPYATCAVRGTELGDDAVTIDFEGREIKVCCKRCEAAFKEDPAAVIAKLDEKIIKDQKKYYPLTTCIMMPEESLEGEDATVVDYVYNNRLIRFCCKRCVRNFRKDPEQHILALDKAVIEKQKADYPATVCVVGGGELGSMGEPVDIVVNNRLVRLCCKGCEKDLMAHPAKYLSRLDKK